MIRKMARLRNEAVGLLTVYEEHKDSDDLSRRRKVHLDIDKFLIEHRETAMLLLAQGLQQEIDSFVATQKQNKRKRRGGVN